MTEDQLEQETLSWLADVGYTAVYGPEIAVDGNAPERSNYTQVVLVDRLRQAIKRLNPLVPLVAREDALQQVLNLDTPVLLAANRAFHQPAHRHLHCAHPRGNQHGKHKRDK